MNHPSSSGSGTSTAWLLVAVIVIAVLGLLSCGGIGIGMLFFYRASHVSRAVPMIEDVPAANISVAPVTPASSPHIARYMTLNSEGRYRAAHNELKAALLLDPQSAALHNYAGWLLATCPDARVRNGEQAVHHATQACNLTGNSQAEFLDTLAAAHAEAGAFDLAVEWQSMAIANLSNSPVSNQQGFRERLEDYKNRKPFREGVPSSEGDEEAPEVVILPPDLDDWPDRTRLEFE